MTKARAAVALLSLALSFAVTSCTQPGGTGGAAPSTTAGARPSARAAAPGDQTTVALISDFGQCDDGERQVADLVRSWDPAIVVTAGDNSQGVAGCVPFTESVGAYYADYLSGPRGPRFFPTLGNHDYDDPGAGLAAYRAFFPYLGTGADPLGRWYVTSVGNLNFYVLDTQAPIAEMPKQQEFLKSALADAAPGTWNIVMLHKPPITSGPHPPLVEMQEASGWKYKEWGANLVIAGHQHILEDVVIDGLHFVTAGVGGRKLARKCAAARTEGSRTCLEGLGAARLIATDTTLAFEYHLIGGSTAPAYRIEIPRG